MKKKLVQCLLFFFLPFCWAQTNPSVDPQNSSQPVVQEKKDFLILKPIPKVDSAVNPCDPPTEAIKSWIDQAMIQLEAQKMQKRPISDIQEQYSRLWFYFRSLRNNKWNMDDYSMKMNALYESFYPSIQRPHPTVFKDMKEPIFICKK